MYLDFFELKKQPFKISCDPDFFWSGKKQARLLSSLRSEIIRGKGHIKLTGDTGTGKTIFVNLIIRSFYGEIAVLKISDPALEINRFYRKIAAAFGFNYDISKGNRFIDSLIPFLKEIRRKGERALLVIDEAQTMGARLIDEMLRWPLKDGQKLLLTILFAGQNEFDDLLEKNFSKNMRSSISLNFRITPLTEGETRAYIRHRLKEAGALREIFKPCAVKEVFSYSKGYPGLINLICDNSMIRAFTEGRKLIYRQTVRKCAAKLTLPGVMHPLSEKKAQPFFTVNNMMPYLFSALTLLFIILTPFTVMEDREPIKNKGNGAAYVRSLKKYTGKSQNTGEEEVPLNPTAGPGQAEPVKNTGPNIEKASIEEFISDVFLQTQMAEMMTRMKSHDITNPGGKEDPFNKEERLEARPSHDPSDIILFIINKRSAGPYEDDP